MSIRDTFFENKAVGALWDVAVSIKRGNPLPLDSNSVFASYTDLETYASGVLAYPGQVVAVVEESQTSLYYLDQELKIKAVGSVPEADESSVSVYENKISLHNYGKYFYKYDEVSETYVKTAVSDSAPWKTGLEPRVVNENEELVLGWFEPNPTTVEGLKSQISSIQTALDSLANKVGSPSNGDQAATGVYVEIEKKANASDVYTKTEADQVIETKVAEGVAAADHLKRKTFNSIGDCEAFIAANPDTAEQYIYMIPSGLLDEDNKYYEYICVERDGENKLEKVGNWEVTLDDYYTKSEVNNKLADKLEQTDLEEALVDYAKTDDLDQTYVTKTALQTELDNKVDVVAGKSLVDDTLIEILGTVSKNAEENYVKSVDEARFVVDETGKLSMKAIGIEDVTNLQTSLNDKLNANELFDKIADARDTATGLFSNANQNKLDSIEEGAQKNLFGSVDADEFVINADELGLKAVAMTKVTGLEAALEAKATKTELETTKTALQASITTVSDAQTNFEALVNKTFATKTELTDVSNRVSDLEAALTWQDLDN